MRRPGPILVMILIAGLLGSVPVTLARFSDSATTDASFATGLLLPPTNLAGTGGPSASLTWTPSTSTGAEGYQVLRSATSGSGYAVVSAVTPVTASATIDYPGGGTWYYVLRTYLQSWTSGNSNEASVVVTSSATGFQACTSNAADTGGDGDGYEGSPADACVTDGIVATDADTGTDTTNRCDSAGKDRHQFWGYPLGLPPAVASIDGIELQLVAGVDAKGGASRICAELSWDGGTSWTAARTVTLNATLRTFTVGSGVDTWGRAWTAVELDAANLRVRLTDVSNRSPKTFRLDGVSLQATYTP
jgi:predicted ribosomally synthesized peptide with SipW-like signal peptide